MLTSKAASETARIEKLLNLRHFDLKGNYRSWHKEKDFMKVISTKLRNLWWIVYHIADVGLGNKFLDIVSISPSGDVILMEMKKTDGYTFNMSQMELGQYHLLKELWHRMNSKAFIVTYSVAVNDYAMFSFDFLNGEKNENGGLKLFVKEKSDA